MDQEKFKEEILKKVQEQFQGQLMNIINEELSKREREPSETLQQELEKLRIALQEKENEIKKLKHVQQEIVDKYEKQLEEMEKESESKQTSLIHDINDLFIKSGGDAELDEITIYENLFTQNEIELIHKLASEIPSSQGTVGKSSVDERMRKSEVKWFDRRETKYEFIYRKIAQAVINANKRRYHFNLSGMVENIQYTIYNTKSGPSYYHFHADSGRVAPYRKLSITVQLSDEKDYQGGDLQFQIVKEPMSVTKKKGTAIIFPSNLQHRVLPITEGERISLVCWISGPPLH